MKVSVDSMFKLRVANGVTTGAKHVVKIRVGC